MPNNQFEIVLFNFTFGLNVNVLKGAAGFVLGEGLLCLTKLSHFSLCKKGRRGCEVWRKE